MGQGQQGKLTGAIGGVRHTEESRVGDHGICLDEGLGELNSVSQRLVAAVNVERDWQSDVR